MRSMRTIPLYLALFFLFWATSCQKEEEEFIDETNEEETITLDSILTGKLLSASQNNGYLDNILDGSSCVSIGLPVTVIANEQKLVINDQEDYALIQGIFDEFENDIDILELVYPVRVVFEDFNDIEVTNEVILNSIIDACQNNIMDTYICVDFVYPINCFTYNSSVEQTGLVTMDDRREWFEYLNYLGENILIAIDYPMGVIIDNDTTLINSNEELNALMSQSDCDLSGGSIDPTTFENKITTASWFVNLLNKQGSDGTCDFLAYEFQFFIDGTASAFSESDNRSGTWGLSIDNGKLELLLDFEYSGSEDPFEDLMATWDVLESTGQTIKLREEVGDTNVFDYLYFGRKMPANCGSGNAQVLIDTLVNGPWFVEDYSDNGTNETGTFSGYEVTFESSGVVVAVKGIYTYYGLWTVEGTTALDLVLDFGLQLPFSEFNSSWDVIDFTANRVELADSSGGESDMLIFGKL